MVQAQRAHGCWVRAGSAAESSTPAGSGLGSGIQVGEKIEVRSRLQKLQVIQAQVKEAQGKGKELGG